MDSTEPEKPQEAQDEKKPEDDLPPPKIDFKCGLCGMDNIKCDYYGTRPPFARKLQITENSFIMKDPFAPPPVSGSQKSNAEYFLIVGVNCAMCEEQVCKGSECSFHYGKTFCGRCAIENIKQFPLEIQSKIRKQINVT